MKKLAIGCGIVLVLCMVALSVVGYIIYSKARQYTQTLTQFAKVAELNNDIANKHPFVAPSNGELTEETVRRFVAVQESMRAKLGTRVEELTKKQDEFNRRQNEEHRQATFSEAYTVVTDMMGLILQAKTAQVEALNAANFSLEEYDWTRRQVYAAAGISIAQFNLDKLQEEMKNGGVSTGDMPKEAISEDVPPRNKALVQPYLPKLKDWAPFAFFGL
jgi:hypothetical protein